MQFPCPHDAGKREFRENDAITPRKTCQRIEAKSVIDGLNGQIQDLKGAPLLPSLAR